MVYNDFIVLNKIIWKDLKNNGKVVEVKGVKTLELLDYSFAYFFYNSIFSNENERAYYFRRLLEMEKQINEVINKLNNETNTRQAIVVSWNDSIKPPCINLIQFLIRDNSLKMIVYLRAMSLDKMRLDLKIFERIAGRIFFKVVKCNEIDRIIVHIGSLHQYLK